MEFNTIIGVIVVAAVAYFTYKAFAKKADTNNDGVVTADEAKAVVVEVVEEAKVAVKKTRATATKAKTAVKKVAAKTPAAKKPAKKVVTVK